MHDKAIKSTLVIIDCYEMHKPFGALCLYGFGRTPNLIVIMTHI